MCDLLNRNSGLAEQEWQSRPNEAHVHSKGQDQQTEGPGCGPPAHATHDERSIQVAKLPRTEIGTHQPFWTNSFGWRDRARVWLVLSEISLKRTLQAVQPPVAYAAKYEARGDPRPWCVHLKKRLGAPAVRYCFLSTEVRYLLAGPLITHPVDHEFDYFRIDDYPGFVSSRASVPGFPLREMACLR